MTSDPFQPTPTDPAGQPIPPAGSPFAPPAMAPDGASAAQPALGAPLAPVQPLPARPRRGGGSGMLVNALLGVALVVAIGGVAFAAGRATAPVAAAATRPGANGQSGAGGGFFGPNASGAPTRGQGFGGGGLGGSVSVTGTVEAIDGSSITIKTAAGTTVTIGLNGDTSYHKQAAASASDVTTGSNVIVQLEGRGFPGGGRPTASGAPSASGAPAAGFGTAGSVTVVP